MYAAEAVAAAPPDPPRARVRRSMAEARHRGGRQAPQRQHPPHRCVSWSAHGSSEARTAPKASMRSQGVRPAGTGPRVSPDAGDERAVVLRPMVDRLKPATSHRDVPRRARPGAWIHPGTIGRKAPERSRLQALRACCATGPVATGRIAPGRNFRIPLDGSGGCRHLTVQPAAVTVQPRYSRAIRASSTKRSAWRGEGKGRGAAGPRSRSPRRGDARRSRRWRPRRLQRRGS